MRGVTTAFLNEDGHTLGHMDIRKCLFTARCKKVSHSLVVLVTRSKTCHLIGQCIHVYNAL